MASSLVQPVLMPCASTDSRLLQQPPPTGSNASVGSAASTVVPEQHCTLKTCRESCAEMSDPVWRSIRTFCGKALGGHNELEGVFEPGAEPPISDEQKWRAKWRVRIITVILIFVLVFIAYVGPEKAIIKRMRIEEAKPTEDQDFPHPANFYCMLAVILLAPAFQASAILLCNVISEGMKFKRIATLRLSMPLTAGFMSLCPNFYLLTGQGIFTPPLVLAIVAGVAAVISLTWFVWSEVADYRLQRTVTPFVDPMPVAAMASMA